MLILTGNPGRCPFIQPADAPVEESDRSALRARSPVQMRRPERGRAGGVVVRGCETAGAGGGGGTGADEAGSLNAVAGLDGPMSVGRGVAGRSTDCWGAGAERAIWGGSNLRGVGTLVWRSAVSFACGSVAGGAGCPTTAGGTSAGFAAATLRGVMKYTTESYAGRSA